MQHLAGNAVIVGNYVVQRCLICGYRMDFADLDRVAVPAENGREYATYKIGGIYEVDGNRTSLVGETDRPEINPEDFPELCFHQLAKDE
jgi:hypothetical protein